MGKKGGRVEIRKSVVGQFSLRIVCQNSCPLFMGQNKRALFYEYKIYDFRIKIQQPAS